jgi:hypothetical protein
VAGPESRRLWQAGPLAALAEMAPTVLASKALQHRADASVPVAALQGVVQRIKDDETDYTDEEYRRAIKHADENPPRKKKAKADDYAEIMADFLERTHARLPTKLKRLALLKRCKEVWNRPSLVAAPVEVEVRDPLDNPEIAYGAEHGDLHFIQTPTQTKSAWTLEKDAALALMEGKIREHLGPLGQHSAANEKEDGWSTFYISDDNGGPIGVYWVPKSEKKQNKFPSTTRFTMQVQVHFRDNVVSYHGYPDQRAEGQPAGVSLTKGGAKLD